VLDYLRPSTERDYEHFVEYAALVHGASGTSAVAEADRLIASGHSIHYHVFAPDDVVTLLRWMSREVQPLDIVEGPCLNPMHEEFHLLVRKGT
jgi:hypothetical protein